MRAWVWPVAVAAVLSLPTARADERTSWPVDVGVNALAAVGAGMGTQSVRTAPAMALDLGLGLGERARFALYGGVSGWTFQDSGLTPSRSELALSAGAALRGALTQQVGWQVAAAPTLTLADAFGQPMAYHPGLLVAPSLELGTRRNSLRFQLGARGLVDQDGLRLMAGGGVTYTFR